MHEISLLENLREILEAEAVKQQFSRVNRITLEIGKLSCVEPDALKFGFDAVMKGSPAENAEIIFVETDGKGLCRNCDQQFAMTTLYEPCPLCGKPGASVLQGREMRILDLIVI